MSEWLRFFSIFRSSLRSNPQMERHNSLEEANKASCLMGNVLYKRSNEIQLKHTGMHGQLGQNMVEIYFCWN